jgi:hypothetical protein
MIKIDLANFDSFKAALLASVDVRARAIILARPESDIQRMYYHAVSAYGLRKLQRPGKGYVSIELCAPDESSPLPTWWEAFLVWREFNWRAGLEPPTRLRLSEALRNGDVGVKPIKKRWTIVGTRPPPQKPFTPLPKSEIGGCARCDSSASAR